MKILKLIGYWIVSIPSKVAVGLIWIYKYALSPYFPGACRYNPSCSDYGIHAIKKHGFFKGIFLTVKRIGRCHPWGGSGYDPVP